MTELGSGAASTRRRTLWIALATTFSLVPSRASAEKVLANLDGWQVYSDGRAGGFMSWAYGQGYPQATYGVDAAGVFANTPIHTPVGGGFTAVTQQGLERNPSLNIPPDNMSILDQGTINLMRLRSGFIANVFGFGVRGPVTAYTTLSTYVQIWAFVENNGRQKNLPNYPDVRQGYAKLEGPWGSFIAGRTRALFSRGATDIDVMYAHRWGVGWPGNLDNNGPTLGQLGFGVLGAGFSSGIIYGTPTFKGFQLNVGLFDPVQLQGFGSWTRTKYARPEAELTFERTYGTGAWAAKVVLFGNGAYQKVYKAAYCAPVTDPETGSIPCEQTVAGVGYGGRVEVGPVHLGVAGHYGQGLGMNYALEASDAAQDRQGNLRKITGWYVQSQVVIRKVDLFAGWGIAQVDRTNYDYKHTHQDPRDPTNIDARVLEFSPLKHQMGINAGIVYNVTPNLHFDLDFFRAQAAWYGVNNFAGQKQVVWVSNGGMLVNW